MCLHYIRESKEEYIGTQEILKYSFVQLNLILQFYICTFQFPFQWKTEIVAT